MILDVKLTTDQTFNAQMTETQSVINTPISNPTGENGLSAYEIAVANGFEGSEKEWLDSLVGPPGPSGPKGDTGVTGPPGPKDVSLEQAAYYGNMSVTPTDHNSFEFNVSNVTNVASIFGCVGDLSGNIVIPYKHVDGEKEYYITNISAYAFENQTQITSVVIPNSVESLTRYAFAGCTKLEKITISNGMKRVFSNAFEDCQSLTDVYYDGTKDEWANIIIGEGNEALLNATIHYSWPDVSKEYVDNKVGDIETALDNIITQQESIIAIQNALIGGDSV